MNNKIKTVLAIAGLVMSVNVSASAAPILVDGNGYAVPSRANANAQNIASIQTTLSNLGYFVGSYGANGEMNNTTRIAIKQFQADAGLKADGVVGLQTAEMLNRFAEGNQWSSNAGFRGNYAPVGYAPVAYAPSPTAYYGNQGYYVAPSNIQYRLDKPNRTGVYW